MKEFNTKELIRMASMFRSFVRAAIVGLLAILALVVIDSAAQAAGNFPAPSNLRFLQLTDKAKQVSWSASSSSPAPITSYVLALDGKDVATYKLQNGLLLTTYTVNNQVLAPGGSLTVTAHAGNGIASLPSAPVSVPAMVASTPSTAVPGATPGSGPKYNQNSFGGFNLPGVKGNALSPAEVYQFSDGFTHVVDTYGNTDAGLKIISLIFVSLPWLLFCFLELVSVGLMAWSLTRQLTGALAGAAISVLNAFGGSVVVAQLMGASLVFWVAWAFYKVAKDRSAVYRTGGFALIGLMLASVFFGFADTAVTKTLALPRDGAQYAMVTVNSFTPHASDTAYNLSVKGTYNGDSMEQGMRRFYNDEFLRMDYPAFCQLSYGDVKWATQTFVKDSPDLPTFKHLTFCEYLLKALKEDNQLAQDKLASDPGAAGTGIGGHVGYVEEASPAAWKVYQGQDVLGRMLNVNVAGLANLPHAGMRGGLTLSLIYTAVFLTIDLFLLGCLLITSILPTTHQQLKKLLRKMAKRTIIPAVVASGLMVMLFIESFLTYVGSDNWMVTMFIRAAVGFVFFIGLIVLLVLWIRSRLLKLKDKADSGDFGQGNSDGNQPGPEQKSGEYGSYQSNRKPEDGSYTHETGFQDRSADSTFGYGSSDTSNSHRPSNLFLSDNSEVGYGSDTDKVSDQSRFAEFDLATTPQEEYRTQDDLQHITDETRIESTGSSEQELEPRETIVRASSV